MITKGEHFNNALPSEYHILLFYPARYGQNILATFAGS